MDISVDTARALKDGTPPSRPIVVDGVFFQLNNTGIARVWHEAWNAWTGSDFARRLIVLDRGGSVPRFDGPRYVRVDSYNANRSGADSLMLQRVCDEHGACAFISTYYTTPTKTPSAVFVYDMIGELMGQTASAEFREKEAGILHAARHLALSGQTRADLARFHPWIDVDRVVVAHCAAAPAFCPAGDGEIAAFREKQGWEKPWLLAVGERVGLNGYKNVSVIFRALGRLAPEERAGLTLVCAGGKPKLEVELAELTAGLDVRCVRLTDAELRLAYAGAQALIYPSRYEGFGLPVAEAMASGCPVITCPCGSLPEVGGDTAIYVDPSDVAGMAEAIRRVGKPGERAVLSEGGLRQAAQFSFKAMADKVAAVLTELADAPLDAMSLRRGMEWEHFRHVQAAGQDAESGVKTLRKQAGDAVKELARAEKKLGKARKHKHEKESVTNAPWKTRVAKWLRR